MKNLKPARPELDRDRLMFRAGQAASRAANWRIPVLTALAGVLLGTAATWLTVRAAWQPEERVQTIYVQVQVPAPAPPAPLPPEQPKQKDSLPTPPAPQKEVANSALWPWAAGPVKPASSYLYLRDQVLRWGVDILPAASPVSFEKPTVAPGNLLQMKSEFLESMGGI